MDARLQKLIGLFKTNDVVPSSMIQATLGVSDRTVRTYVARINAQLDGIARIVMERGRGYIFSVDDPAALERVTQALGERGDSVPQTRDERVRYLINDLLNRSDWVTLDTLSTNLFVSRFTVSDDLKEVELVLQNNGLALERRSHKGVRVSGPEFNRRVCLANLALERSSTEEMRGAVHVLGDRLGETVERVARHVDALTKAHNLSVNPVAYQNLLVHIAVAVLRLRSDHRVSMEGNQLARISQVDVYPAACELADAVGSEFGLCFPPEEVAYIAIHLSGKQAIKRADISEDGEKGLPSTAVPQEAWDAATRMIDHIWRCFGFDFRSDFELRMNLATHIAPLSVRLQYGMQMRNPLLTDIRTRFTLAYSMASEAASVLAELYHRTPSDDEVGYLALSFALALDRQKTGTAEKKSILLVCASGVGTARLLEHRFRALFGDRLDRIETCDARAVSSADLSGIDCIFTAVPLPDGFSVPVVSVGAFLDDAEIPEVRAVLEARPQDYVAELERFFDPRLFFSHLTFDSKASALAFLCGQMRDIRDADDRIDELVARREHAAVTSFGNRVAMPHPVDPVVSESVVAVALLDRPLDWGNGKEVQAIFLICVSRYKDRGLQLLYRALARIMGSSEAMDALIDQQRFDTLLNLLQQESKG